MSAPPKTVLEVSPAEEEAIRLAVRDPDLALLGADCFLASSVDAAALSAFLADPAVSDPIYDLPRPLTEERVRAWIEDALQKQARGEAVLTLRRDDRGEVIGYSYFTIWPDRSAAEIAGAQRADRQNAGRGKAGAARSFDWMFEMLGVRLICVTAALDNVRSARVIEAAGFAPMGERDSLRPDGSIRRSLYWEMTRDAWRARR